MKTADYLLYEVTVKYQDPIKLQVWQERQNQAAALKRWGVLESYPEPEAITHAMAVPAQLGAGMVDYVLQGVLELVPAQVRGKAFIEQVAYKGVINVMLPVGSNDDAERAQMAMAHRTRHCGARNLARGWSCIMPANHDGAHSDGEHTWAEAAKEN
jgi:hypothetical protein